MKANVSATNTVTSTVMRTRRPSGSSSRTRTRKPRPSPIHAAPSTVVATATVVDWRVSETAAKTKARSNVSMKPPSIHSGPPSDAPSTAASAPP